MIVSLSDAKAYIRVDYNDEDSVITNFILTAENVAKDILRVSTLPDTPLVKTAVLYMISYLYEHREDANMKVMTESAFYILTPEREPAF